MSWKSKTIRRPRWDRWNGAIVVALVAAVAVAAVASVATIRARAGLRALASGSLTNYAAVAAEQFGNGYEGLLRQSFVPVLPPAGEASAPSLEGMVATAARLERDPCRCLISVGPAVFFRIGLESGALEAVDRNGRPAPMAAATVAAVRAQSGPLASLGWPYGILVVPAPGGQRVVLFANRRSAGGPAVFGLEMSAAHVADQVWAAAFRGSRLVPRHLLATVPSNPEYLAIEVSAPDGQRLYASAAEYADGPTDALNMPPLRGGVTVRARLNPRVKAALIPGGVPARRPDRELAFIALSVGLIAAVAGVGFRAADLARVRADFVASVSHELRTPLTQIRLSAETVLHGRSRDRASAQRALEGIVQETDRLRQLVDNVLHFSRAERHQIRVDPARLELAPLVRQIVADYGPLAAERVGAIRAAVPDGLEARVDPAALRQILVNLLDNAVRHGPPGQTVRVSAIAGGSGVDLLVDDEGSGIAATDRERVWRPFVRLRPDAAQVATGTGLGLAVVRELVEAHGGTCRIEDAPGGGARVVLRFPAGGAI